MKKLLNILFFAKIIFTSAFAGNYFSKEAENSDSKEKIENKVSKTESFVVIENKNQEQDNKIENPIKDSNLIDDEDVEDFIDSVGKEKEENENEKDDKKDSRMVFTMKKEPNKSFLKFSDGEKTGNIEFENEKNIISDENKQENLKSDGTKEELKVKPKLDQNNNFIANTNLPIYSENNSGYSIDDKTNKSHAYDVVLHFDKNLCNQLNEVLSNIKRKKEKLLEKNISLKEDACDQFSKNICIKADFESLVEKSEKNKSKTNKPKNFYFHCNFDDFIIEMTNAKDLFVPHIIGLTIKDYNSQNKIQKQMINFFSNLRRITIYNKSHPKIVEEEDLFSEIGKLKNLKSLKLISLFSCKNTNFSKRIFELISNHCKKLKRLELQVYSKLESISNLLYLDEKIIKNLSKNLTHLLTTNCCYIDQFVLCNMNYYFKNLKVLKSACIFELDDNFLDNLFEIKTLEKIYLVHLDNNYSRSVDFMNNSIDRLVPLKDNNKNSQSDSKQNSIIDIINPFSKKESSKPLKTINNFKYNLNNISFNDPNFGHLRTIGNFSEFSFIAGDLGEKVNYISSDYIRINEYLKKLSELCLKWRSEKYLISYLEQLVKKIAEINNSEEKDKKLEVLSINSTIANFSFARPHIKTIMEVKKEGQNKKEEKKFFEAYQKFIKQKENEMRLEKEKSGKWFFSRLWSKFFAEEKKEEKFIVKTLYLKGLQLNEKCPISWNTVGKIVKKIKEIDEFANLHFRLFDFYIKPIDLVLSCIHEYKEDAQDTISNINFINESGMPLKLSEIAENDKLDNQEKINAIKSCVKDGYEKKRQFNSLSDLEEEWIIVQFAQNFIELTGLEYLECKRWIGFDIFLQTFGVSDFSSSIGKISNNENLGKILENLDEIIEEMTSLGGKKNEKVGRFIKFLQSQPSFCPCMKSLLFYSEPTLKIRQRAISAEIIKNQ